MLNYCLLFAHTIIWTGFDINLSKYDLKNICLEIIHCEPSCVYSEIPIFTQCST